MNENEVQTEIKDEKPVETKSEVKEKNVPVKEKTEPAKKERDFNAEMAMLNKAYPELDQLPPEVLKASVKDGKPVLAAYEAYRSSQMVSEIEALKEENRILRQNAEAASRAPVTSVSEGGSPAEEALDPFIAILGE